MSETKSKTRANILLAKPVVLVGLMGAGKSTIGRRLESLEASLGVRLFHRTAAGYLITPEGTRVLADAEAR